MRTTGLNLLIFILISLNKLYSSNELVMNVELESSNTNEKVDENCKLISLTTYKQSYINIDKSTDDFKRNIYHDIYIRSY